MCNRHIKFGGFYEWAVENGFDAVATGHYARSENGRLFTATDNNKDQTYFLWTLSNETLKKTLFPLGNLLKEEVRGIARERGVPVADKKDSQGVCFLGHIDLEEFLGHYIDLVPGKVLDVHGNVIGKHKGAQLYTVGQRHGFTISPQSPGTEKHFVKEKDINKNTITVSSESETRSDTKSVKLVDVVLREEIITKKLLVRYRYRQNLIRATLNLSNNTVTFKQPQQFVSVGQSVVLYLEDECIGGGIIDTVI